VKAPSAAALVCVLASCAGPQLGPLTVSSATLAASPGIVNAIARARCERHGAACTTYASLDECAAAETAPTAYALQLEQCTTTIDPRQVDACVEAVRGEPCARGIASIDACHWSRMCP
jgi:hypothetical protein